MKRVKLTDEGLYGVKRTENGIYNMYTTEEVLSMTDVSEKEKMSVKIVGKFSNVIGWVESIYFTEEDKIFIQVYDEQILKVVEQNEKM